MSSFSTPRSVSASPTPPNEKVQQSDERLFTDSQLQSSQSSSQALQKSLSQLAESQSQSQHRTPTPSPPGSPKHSQPESPKLMFSGLQLPASLRSFISQTLPEKVKKRSRPNSPRRSRVQSPKRSRRNSFTNAIVKPKSTIHWDDDEIVFYGREKVYSLSGYQLQMSSLLGILYATTRILQIPLLARDFELYDMSLNAFYGIER